MMGRWTENEPASGGSLEKKRERDRDRERVHGGSWKMKGTFSGIRMR